MYESEYYPNPAIPKMALYLGLRGRYGHKRCPKDVNSARSFAKRNPELGAGAEALIQELYGGSMRLLNELDAKYQKLTDKMKQTAPWQAAAELFVAGEIRRVLRMF